MPARSRPTPSIRSDDRRRRCSVTRPVGAAPPAPANQSGTAGRAAPAARQPARRRRRAPGASARRCGRPGRSTGEATRGSASSQMKASVAFMGSGSSERQDGQHDDQPDEDGHHVPVQDAGLGRRAATRRRPASTLTTPRLIASKPKLFGAIVADAGAARARRRPAARAATSSTGRGPRPPGRPQVAGAVAICVSSAPVDSTACSPCASGSALPRKCANGAGQQPGGQRAERERHQRDLHRRGRRRARAPGRAARRRTPSRRTGACRAPSGRRRRASRARPRPARPRARPPAPVPCSRSR